MSGLIRTPASCRAATGSDRAEREAATLAAMRSGAALIVGGRLPADLAGRRVGEPDLLVPRPGRGYRAVDIKHHRSLDRTGARVPPRGRPDGDPAQPTAHCARR